MKTLSIPKRRRGVRYIVKGEVIFHTGSPESCGDLVNIGARGMLVRTKVCVPEGTTLQVGFTVDGYPVAFQGPSQVAGASPDLLAMKFFDEPPELPQLLRWLERENLPWAGLDDSDSEAAARFQRGSLSPSEPSADPVERQELEAILPFLDAIG